MKFLKAFRNPIFILSFLIIGLYYPFFLFGKIPLPGDVLIGGYFPWLDYKWGFDVGVPVKNPSISDVYSQFFLWKYLAVDFLKAGILPLWNPYSFSGTPFLATYHSAVFFPFNLLLFLPKYYGWGFYIFGQTLISALGMYFLLGRFIKSSPAKIGGALVFSLSGLMTTWLEFGTAVWAASFLPWVILSLELFWSTHKFRYLLLLVFSFVCLYLAGHAQITIYASVIFLAYVVYFQFKPIKEIRLLNICLPLLAWVLAILICAFQFLPTFEFTNLSIRADEKFNERFNFGLSPWNEIIKLIAPDFYGSPVTYNQWKGGVYYEYSSFLGSLTLPLILPFVLKRFRNKYVTFWGFILLLSLVLVFPNPISKWFYSLQMPFLTYSFASRIYFVTSFSAGILFGLAFQSFFDNHKYQYWVRRTAAAFLAILLGIFLGAIISMQIVRDIKLDEAVTLISNLKVSLKNSILPFLVIFCLFLAAQFKLRKIVVYFILLILFLDLGRYFHKFNPFIDQNLVFPQTPAIEFLKKIQGNFRIARADRETMPPNTWTHFKIESAEGYDPLALESYGRFFNKVNNFSFNGGVSRYIELDNYPSKYLDALNVRYLVAIKRDKNGLTPGDLLNYKVQASPYKEVFSDKSTAIVENPSALERAYFVNNVFASLNPDELIRRIEDKSFDPTKQAVLETQDKFDEGLGSGFLEIQKISPNEKIIKTKTEKDGFVVVADSYDPGWKVFENGVETKLYKSNLALQGFKVNPGENEYTLVYSPKSFFLGSFISLIGLIFTLILLVFSYKRKIL